MRVLSKLLVIMLAALLCLALAAPALADVTAVKPLGDGAVEVRWDDSGDIDYLVFVPKMSNSFDDDVAAYGRLLTDDGISGKNKMVQYSMAPGQSYWIQTQVGSSYTKPFAYKAARAESFSEWKTPPKITSFVLKIKDMEGRYDTADYLPANEMETGSSMSSYGAYWRIDYPQLKKARSFLWQVVITTPDGVRYVLYPGTLELPRGRAYVHNDFMDMTPFFNALMDTREEIPVGTYTFSIFWDGQHACSTTFKVR